MSDTEYPVTPNFKRVGLWNMAALIYRHGNLMQQSLKLFRHLGDVSEGVQKMNNLTVAAGIGKLTVSLVGLVSFAGVTPEKLGEMYESAGVRYSSVSTPHYVNEIARTLVDLVKSADRLSASPENDVDINITTHHIIELFSRLKGLAVRCNLKMDRCVENATNGLCKKIGKMDEFGLFHAEETTIATSRTGFVHRGVGEWIKLAINRDLEDRFAELTSQFQFESNGGEVRLRVEEAMNSHLEFSLTKHVRMKPTVKHLLNGLTPAVVVTQEGNRLDVTSNIDLQTLFTELEKVTE